MMYKPINHHMDTLSPMPNPLTAIAITTYPKATNPNPMAIFLGDDGSSFLAYKNPQTIVIIGAKAITANGFTDWKYEAGISQPNNVLSVCLSANNVNDAPACSKAPQKKITKKARMKITVIRCVSIFDKLLSLKINIGMAIIAP